MHVAVIGLGSMGRRRIRLIRQYDPEAVIVGVDLNEQRCAEAKAEYRMEVCSSLEQAAAEYGVTAAFISTSPLSHAAIIQTCLDRGLHVFTELNLVADRYDELIRLAREKDRILFLSSTFLYRAETAYLTEAVRASAFPLRYLYHIGQYLPDWHPWEPYQNFFISDSRTNGCREIFAIELPWLIRAFGPVRRVHTVRDRITDLKIEYPDAYLVTLEHESGHKGVLNVDVVARKAVRNFEVYGQDLYASWDGTPQGLRRYDPETKQDTPVVLYDRVDKLDGYSASIIENAYFNEVACFFDTIAGRQAPRYTFEDDKEVLALIDRMEGGPAWEA